MNRKKIINILKDKNIQITINRIKIIECLCDSYHFHTISDIVKHVNLNTKSVYNNIKLLIKKGVVDSFSFGGIAKYALNDLIQTGKTEIHIVNGLDITHKHISPSIFENIKKQVETPKQKIQSIKIFVNVEEKWVSKNKK